MASGTLAPHAPRLPTAAFFVAAVGPRTAAGVEIAGDHDSDRLHPARHVPHGVEAALGDDVVFGMTLLAPRLLVDGVFDAEELEPLVVLVVAAGYRGEIIATPAGKARARRRAIAVAFDAAPASTLRGFASGFGCRPTSGVVAPTTPAPPTAALAIGGAAARLTSLRLPRVRTTVSSGKWLVVVIIARLAPGWCVAARLAGPLARRCTAATAAASTPPAPPARPPLFVEWPLERLARDGRPFVGEIFERFRIDTAVARRGFVAEAGRSVRCFAVAPATATATATTPATAASGPPLAVRFGAFAARLAPFAAAAGVGRLAAIATVGPLRSFGSV